MDHGLNTTAIAVLAVCVIRWSLVSARLERVNVTAPIAFVALGLVVTHPPLTLIQLSLPSTAIRGLTELTLALVWFVFGAAIVVPAFGHLGWQALRSGHRPRRPHAQVFLPPGRAFPAP